MGDFSITDMIWVGLLSFFIIKMWPNAMHWVKNSPKGNSNDWTQYILLMAGVALFIMLLIASV